jgi:hypothetical protein
MEDVKDTFKSGEFLDFHSGAFEASVLLGCGAASLCDW